MCCNQRSNTVWHYGPLIALTLISVITTSTVGCLLRLFPAPSLEAIFILVSFLAVALGTIISFFAAMYRGGGNIKKGWRPKNKDDEQYLQYCKICKGFKPPRSHHDHVSGRCISKMDHFCPWINSAVGNGNQIDFLAFVFLAPLGCFFATIIQGVFLYMYIPKPRYWKYISHTNPAAFQEILFTVIGLACAVAVCIAVGLLCCMQISGIWSNMTQIEQWIISKANRREDREAPFVFPYDLGSGVANVTEVFRQWYSGDGVTWAVREDCDQYTLTREQLAQKATKRRYTVTHVVTQATAHWLCRGMEFGFCSWWRSPWPSEPRIQVARGDIVRVWSIDSGWLYGEKVVIQNGKFESVKPRQRGWFPEICVEVADGVGVGGDTLAEEVAATVAAIKAMQATSADARGGDTQTGTVAADKEKHD
eukprot:m.1190434 g.1190434  ORF g.1190434 m.1190434 type:complete len:421 (+) comp24555_c1_seq17:150-1412(+)